MKLKSTLWVFAIACAAVSCSDDEIINGPSNEEGGATAEGPQTYMTVTLNTPTTTKANPMGGEEGDGYEVGEENEWTVKDVTVILFTDKDGNTPTTFSADCNLVGAGYKDNLQMSVSDTEHHNRQATVTVSIKDGNFDEKTYGVITVTNWGSDALKKRITNDVTTGAQLADLLVTEVCKENKQFIMSTHNDQYGSGDQMTAKYFDNVTLKANATPENAPVTEVHVERLAAKVRVNAYSSSDNEEANTTFIYTLNNGKNNEAKIRLNHVAIVNQLTSGTYLLKRVADATDDKKIVELTEGGHDSYLGNETAEANGTGTNYVINPWTRAIDALSIGEGFDWNNLTVASAAHTPSTGSATSTETTNLRYTNGVVGKATYSDLWNAVSSNAGALGAESSEKFSPYIVYTQENTTSAKMSKNGFSTGALFQATYLPKMWMAVTKEGEKDVVKPVEIDYNGEDSEGKGYDDKLFSTIPENFVFYVYRGNIYKDYEAIFNAYVWLQQKEVEGQTGASIYDYSDFKSDKITQLKKSDFKNSLLYQFADAEPLGYLAYLKSKCSDSDNAEATFSQGEDIVSYIASEGGKAKIAENVNTYEEGTCYYPYWIRHANNNKPNEMGIMEFGIVRNNIYELAVKSIGSLGLSGVDKPEPDKDDETNEVFFSVEIKVKDWVVRKNNDIIL